MPNCLHASNDLGLFNISLLFGDSKFISDNDNIF